jgi:hypothetical protein
LLFPVPIKEKSILIEFCNPLSTVEAYPIGIREFILATSLIPSTGIIDKSFSVLAYV